MWKKKIQNKSILTDLHHNNEKQLQNVQLLDLNQAENNQHLYRHYRLFSRRPLSLIKCLIKQILLQSAIRQV